jgi:hypothetical protein
MKWLFLIAVLARFSGCVEYKFADIDVGDAETVSVEIFDVQAPVAPPNSGQVFSIKLQDAIQAQTNLSLTNGSTDIKYEGTIVSYSIRPAGIQSNETSAQNRLTIGVKVKYINNLDKSKNFEQSFSQFADYSSNLDISSVQDELIDQIFEQITVNVINKSFGSW